MNWISQLLLVTFCLFGTCFGAGGASGATVTQTGTTAPIEERESPHELLEEIAFSTTRQQRVHRSAVPPKGPLVVVLPTPVGALWVLPTSGFESPAQRPVPRLLLRHAAPRGDDPLIVVKS